MDATKMLNKEELRGAIFDGTAYGIREFMEGNAFPGSSIRFGTEEFLESIQDSIENAIKQGVKEVIKELVAEKKLGFS